VSYCWKNSKEAHKDAKGDADPRKIAAALTDASYGVWLDIQKLGKQGLYDEIAQGLRDSKIVVACISDDYAESPNCVMELTHASKNLKMPIIVCAVGEQSLKWYQSTVGLIASSYKYLMMQSQKEFEDNLPRLIEQVKKELIPKAANVPNATENWIVDHISMFKAKVEELQRGFLRIVYSAHQAVDFPRVFALHQHHQGDGGHTTKVQFLCESPGEWHLLHQHNGFPLSDHDHFVNSNPNYLAPLSQILEVMHIPTFCKAYGKIQVITKQDAEDLKQWVTNILGLQMITCEEVEKKVNLKRISLPTQEILWLCDFHRSQIKY